MMSMREAALPIRILSKIYSRCFKCRSYRVPFLSSLALESHDKAAWKQVNTFCQVSLESSHSRTHIPSGGGCGDVHPLQGPLRSASISLPRLAVPLLPGARGSTAHNGPGPSQCNMSGRWSILRLWASFCGHVRVRSLLLVRTSCGTIIKTKLVRDARQWKEFNM